MINQNYTYIFRPYRALNTLRLGYNNQSLNAVCSEMHKKHTKTVCGQNVEFLDVKPGGTYSNHRAVEG
jgi:hypothetical protein